MKLSERLERELAVQISAKDARRKFEDGKPHELTFVDAIFLDGESLQSELHAPLVMHAECIDYDAFEAAFDEMVSALTKVHRDAVYEGMLAVRAAAVAGLEMALCLKAYEEHRQKRLGGMPPGIDERLVAASTVLGTALGLGEERMFWEGGLMLPGPIAAIFSDFLKNTPVRLVQEWPEVKPE